MYKKYKKEQAGIVFGQFAPVSFIFSKAKNALQDAYCGV